MSGLPARRGHATIYVMGKLPFEGTMSATQRSFRKEQLWEAYRKISEAQDRLAGLKHSFYNPKALDEINALLVDALKVLELEALI